MRCSVTGLSVLIEEEEKSETEGEEMTEVIEN